MATGRMMTHPWELRRRHRLLLFYIGIHTRVHTFDNIVVYFYYYNSTTICTSIIYIHLHTITTERFALIETGKMN